MQKNEPQNNEASHKTETKANKYHKSIIYKLEHVTNHELLYIGGTTNFSARKAQHKSRTLNPNDKEHNVYKYKMIRENGGWDMFRMVPLKTVSVESKRELEMEEEKFRELYKAKMNSYKSYVNDAPVKPSEDAKIVADFNAYVKLQKYREENKPEIERYRNEKQFLSIKKKKYSLDDYKEAAPEAPTFSHGIRD
jgi:hypothetical protein